MPSRHEKQKPKIPEFRFQPEGYLDPDSEEFLEQFLTWLQEQHIPTEDLVYTGLDGKNSFNPDGTLRRPDAIFGMNETGWRHQIETSQTTPAGFIKKDAEIPLIAIFDGAQLLEPKTYRLEQDDDYFAPVEIRDINPGRPEDQRPIQPDDLVEEVVIHRDFPDASPVDALVGLVYIEEETYKSPRDHGF